MSDLTAYIQCPNCGRVNDGHSDVGIGDQSRGPGPGDVGICWGCGAPSIFEMKDGVLTQRAPTEAEADVIARTPAFVEAMALAAYGRAEGLDPTSVKVRRD